VAAVGGDGTVNEVARALVNSNTALGIVPYGSGNGLARHLGIPISMRQSLELLKTATPHSVDYGLVNEVPFFCTAGIGFDALVGNRYAAAGTRGIATYMQKVLSEIATYKPEEYAITIDGKTIRRSAFLVTFANASQWGYNAYIAPAASLSDGMLDVVVVGKFPLLRAPEMGVQLLVKQIDKLHFVETFRCRAATLRRDREGYVHFDGEPGYMGSEVNVQVVHAALKVMTKKKKI
jgi:YegS/Rv2252/BmrU family lipid kinase